MQTLQLIGPGAETSGRGGSPRVCTQLSYGGMRGLWVTSVSHWLHRLEISTP